MTAIRNNTETNNVTILYGGVNLRLVSTNCGTYAATIEEPISAADILSRFWFIGSSLVNELVE